MIIRFPRSGFDPWHKAASETNALNFLIEIFPEDLFDPPVRKEHDRE